MYLLFIFSTFRSGFILTVCVLADKGGLSIHGCYLKEGYPIKQGPEERKCADRFLYVPFWHIYVTYEHE